MKKEHEQIKKLANLARLKLDQHELDEMAADFNKILGFIDKLGEVNTSNIQPLTHIHKIENHYREDEVQSDSNNKALLNLAPEKNSDYIKVPKVKSKK